MPSLDDRIAALAARDRPLAEKILKEAIRIPADHVDRPVEEGGDPECGLSNHEGPRLEYLRRTVVERRHAVPPGLGRRRPQAPGEARQRDRSSTLAAASAAMITYTFLLAWRATSLR